MENVEINDEIYHKYIGYKKSLYDTNVVRVINVLHKSLYIRLYTKIYIKNSSHKLNLKSFFLVCGYIGSV